MKRRTDSPNPRLRISCCVSPSHTALQVPARKAIPFLGHRTRGAGLVVGIYSEPLSRQVTLENSLKPAWKSPSAMACPESE